MAFSTRGYAFQFSTTTGTVPGLLLIVASLLVVGAIVAGMLWLVLRPWGMALSEFGKLSGSDRGALLGAFAIYGVIGWSIYFLNKAASLLGWKRLMKASVSDPIAWSLLISAVAVLWYSISTRANHENLFLLLTGLAVTRWGWVIKGVLAMVKPKKASHATELEGT